MVHEGYYAPFRWPRFTLMARTLASMGHDVTVYSFGRSVTLPEDPKIVDLLPGKFLPLVSGLVHIFSRKVIWDFGLLFPLIAQLRRERPQVVIFHHVHVGICLILAKRILDLDATLVYDWNDLGVRLTIFPRRPALVHRFWLWAEESLVPRNSDLVIVITHFAKNLLRARGLSAGRIVVVNELVPLRTKQTGPNRTQFLPIKDRTIIWHGFVRPYQVAGLLTVIEALGMLAPTVRPKFRIVGPFAIPEDKDRLSRRARQLGVDVEFLGFVPHEDLDVLLDSADAGVQVLPKAPFTRFINGVKLAEYVAHGLPVLCSNLEGPSELVNGNGLLIDTDLPGSLAEAILCLFSDRYPEFCRRAIEMANDEFSVSAIEAKISSLIQRLETRIDHQQVDT